MSDLTWVSDPERDDWIFGVREAGDETNAWYSLKHLSSENDAVNASIQMHFPSAPEAMGFCSIIESLYQTYLNERENNA
jgi:hypothetical protein